MNKITQNLLILGIVFAIFYGSLYACTSYQDIDAYHYLLYTLDDVEPVSGNQAVFSGRYTDDNQPIYVPSKDTIRRQPFKSPPMMSLFEPGNVWPNLVHIWKEYAFIWSCMAGFLCVMLVYACACKFSDDRTAFYVSLFFMIDPLSYFNLGWRLFDKNPFYISIFLFLFALTLYKDIFPTEKYWFFKLVGYCYAFSVWEAWYIIIFLDILLMFIIAATTKPNSVGTVIYGLMISLAILIIAGRYSHVITWEVAELRPALFFFSMSYLVYGFIVGWIYSIKKHPVWLKFYFFLVMISFLVIFRMHSFFVPMIWIMSAPVIKILLESKTMHIFAFLMIAVMITSYPMYLDRDYHDEKLFPEIDKAIASGKPCLVSDWGKGHVLQYMVYERGGNMSVKYKGHPTGEYEVGECYEMK